MPDGKPGGHARGPPGCLARPGRVQGESRFGQLRLGIAAVVEVVLPVLGEDGVPDLALAADAGKSAGLKGPRRELVALIGPLAVRAAVGDPPQHADVPVG
ncbi:MAG: hypothetical protein ACRDPY_22685 [Streptosporangiaceae bacterium]